MSKRIVRYGGFGLLVLVAATIMILKPFSSGLENTGQMVIGGLLIAIGIWIFKPFDLPFSMGSAFLAFFLLLQGLAPSVVFAGFTQSALWTLIPALFFGFVLQKTGLGKRIALAIIKIFPANYFSLILAWALIGIVLSIPTPSITVRVAIVMPIALHCCELYGLEKGSKGNSLILLSAFAMALLPGSGWLSGSLWGPIIQGLYNGVAGMEGLINFNSWLSVAFIPMEVVSVVLLIGGYFVLKPETPLSKDAAWELKNSKAEPLSRAEKATGIILVSVFLMFVTNGFHGIPDAAVCLFALILFFVFKVMEVQDISSGISWDLVIFLGMALGLGAVFSATGIADWIAGIVVVALAPVAGNPVLLLFVVTIIMFAWRFVDIATFIPTMAILVPALPSIAAAYELNPLVWILMFVMAGNAMFMAYQNLWALMSQSISGERAWTASHLGKYGLVYFVACMVGLAVASVIFTVTGLW